MDADMTMSADDRESGPMLGAIGRVVAAGARLEWALVDLHEVLLYSPRGHVAVAGESFDQARRGCLELAEHVGEPVRSQVRSAVLLAETAWRERNHVVHGLWIIGLEGQTVGEALTLRLRKTGRELRAWSLEQLDEVARLIDVAARGLNDLDTEFRSQQVVDRLGGQPSFES